MLYRSKGVCVDAKTLAKKSPRVAVAKMPYPSKSVASASAKNAVARISGGASAARVCVRSLMRIMPKKTPVPMLVISLTLVAKKKLIMSEKKTSGVGGAKRVIRSGMSKTIGVVPIDSRVSNACARDDILRRGR